MTTIIDVRKLFDGKERKERGMGYQKLKARNEKVVIEDVLDDGHRIIFFESGYGVIPIEGDRDLVIHIIDLVENPFMYDEDAYNLQSEGFINPADYFEMDWRTYIYFQMMDRLQHRINAKEEKLRVGTYEDGVDSGCSDSAEEEFFKNMSESMDEDKQEKIIKIIKSRLSDKEWDSFLKFYGEGKSQRKIAAEEGKSQQMIMKRIKRGKAKLDPVIQTMMDIYFGNNE
ncbi:MAG: sigma-70 family RNA polymerase sigma factor [Eubacterium sp.]|nr:sigma-70 family RNA polymerase sigma factor [Eubacterium sp.]